MHKYLRFAAGCAALLLLVNAGAYAGAGRSMVGDGASLFNFPVPRVRPSYTLPAAVSPFVPADQGTRGVVAGSVLPVPRPRPLLPPAPQVAVSPEKKANSSKLAAPQTGRVQVAATKNAPSGRNKTVMAMGLTIQPSDKGRLRFVLELSDPVPVRAFTLKAPNRVVLDMPAVEWRLANPPRPVPGGVIRAYRYGLFRPGNSRFVIDLDRPVSLAEALVVPPKDGFGYRVVIDLIETGQSQFDKKAGWPADLKAREEQAEKIATTAPPPPRKKTKRVIIIDPGHGGLDSGTIGAGGIMEKDIVLAQAKMVAQALAARGFAVHMTRDIDTFIPLPQRVAIARNWKADLFISIHADSNPNMSVTGLSIYTLSEKGSDEEAAALARKENQSDSLVGLDLAGDNASVAPILIDLAQRDTMNKSSRFAQGALETLGKVTDLLPRQPHRSAGFRVLKAPDVPAVLIELGYLSNPAEAQRLARPAWRKAVADAIAAAVVRHFSDTAEASGKGR